MADTEIREPTVEAVPPISQSDTLAFVSRAIDAIDKGISAEHLKSLVDLHERVRRLDAEQAYNEAMNRCQRRMQTVIKTKKNPDTGKMYAPHEDIVAIAQPVYTEEGFSLSFGTLETGTEGEYHVYVDVQHVKGHSKRYTIHNVPIDDKGPKGGPTKTKIQGQMSSMSYTEGRLVRLVFAMVVADQDKDGNGKRISPDQLAELNDLLVATNSDLRRFLQWAGIESLDLMPERDFVKAKDALIRKKGNGK